MNQPTTHTERIIKFRGFEIKKDQWVYGDLWRCYHKNSQTDFVIRDGNGHMNDTLVMPRSVGQFTGLKDNNGTEIYEGDIVKVGNKIMPVVFKKGCWKTLHGTSEYRLWGWKTLLEVIGNVYQNPKFLNPTNP